MHACASNFTNTFRILAKDVAVEDKIASLLSETLPTDYFKKSIRIIANPNITKQQIDAIVENDYGFNKEFLTEQPLRRQALKQLYEVSCEDRTATEKKMWQSWLQKYESLQPDKQLCLKHTIQYVLLNEVAKNIT